jgi:hypothetical protein
MCNDDLDIEDFVKKNRKKIEEILKKEDNSNEDASDDEHQHTEIPFGGFKIDLGPMEKIGDAMKEMISLFLDPKVQKHFIKAGKEIFTGIEEMIKNAPIPEEMKDAMDKAHEMKDKIVDDLASEFGPEAKKEKEKKAKGKKMKKIDVE